MVCEHTHKDAPDNAVCEDCYNEDLGANVQDRDESVWADDPHGELQEGFCN